MICAPKPSHPLRIRVPRFYAPECCERYDNRGRDPIAGRYIFAGRSDLIVRRMFAGLAAAPQ
jgi:hypothetical protein